MQDQALTVAPGGKTKGMSGKSSGKGSGKASGKGSRTSTKAGRAMSPEEDAGSVEGDMDGGYSSDSLKKPAPAPVVATTTAKHSRRVSQDMTNSTVIANKARRTSVASSEVSVHSDSRLLPSDEEDDSPVKKGSKTSKSASPSNAASKMSSSQSNMMKTQSAQMVTHTRNLTNTTYNTSDYVSGESEEEEDAGFVII